MNSPGIDFPWLRRIRVTFEGLTGGGNSTYECDGTQERVRAIARVHKVIQGMPSATNLMLFNLSESTRGAFQRGKTKVRIEAGWDHGPFKGLKQCFYGSFVTAYSQRAGSDIVTSINAISAVDDLTTVSVLKTWPPKYPVMEMVKELRNMLPGVKRDDARIKGFESRKVGTGGWSHHDTVRSAFDRLSAEFGFSWTICDGCFQAIKDKMGFGGNTVIQDPYLIDVNPVFTGQGTEQNVVGLRVRSTFNAIVNPMFHISVQSKIEPKYNGGKYIVQTVDHDLGCFSGDPFITSINTIIDPDSGTFRSVNGL